MEQWSSLSEFITSEEADFVSQLLANFPAGLDYNCSAMNMAGLDGSSYCASDSVDNTDSYIFSQENSFPTSSQENYNLGDSHHPILMTNLSSMALDFCIGYDCLNQENLQLKSRAPEPEQAAEDKKNNPSENAKKRSRSYGDIQKKKSNVKLKKINNEEDVNGGLNRQSSSSCCSEDDSNGSQSGGGSSSVSSKGAAALNLNGKIRASRGSATDPQSLYARKRRERINERLRALQRIVPNGTKVDISTMLEEAVQYVKFLQLQIKLLSSDDLWMYAPLAYNGMDIGLDMKITKPR